MLSTPERSAGQQQRRSRDGDKRQQAPCPSRVILYAVAGYRPVTHSVLRSYLLTHQADY
jgi:hypothetical protein